MPPTNSPHTTEYAVFPLLADPGGYVACPWDLTADAPHRAYWIDLFRKQFVRLLKEALDDAADRGEDAEDARQRADQARKQFSHYLDVVAVDPDRFGRLDILQICYQRENALRAAGFEDPYRLVKTRETDQALKLLPRLLTDLDAMDEAARWVAVMQGILAGNIFDLGATQAMEMFAGQVPDFHETRQSLPPRPWFCDDVDAWLTRLNGVPHRAAVVFVDNAGPDIVLGMIPFARELLKRGTRVILAANSQPALNDVTYPELVALIDALTGMDAVMAKARSTGDLMMMASGNWAPLIDLKQVSAALAAVAVAEKADLVVLEGMGRAVESNFDARFTCDVLKIAMIKDQGVADKLGGKMFDLVVRFERRGDFGRHGQDR